MSLTPNSVLHRLLALALLLAPLVSTAMPVEGSVEAAAMTAEAGHAHAAHGDASAEVSSDSMPCDQHANCEGMCCAACAHCVTGAPMRVDPTSDFRPVQAPGESRLHSTLVVSAPSRPPQAV